MEKSSCETIVIISRGIQNTNELYKQLQREIEATINKLEKIKLALEKFIKNGRPESSASDGTID